MDRRSMLSSGALVGLGAVAGCATNSDAATDAKTLFSVPQPMLPVAGASEMFPVRRIYCIGRNYVAHAREMGSDPTREPPFFFQKPTDAVQVVLPGKPADHPYPQLTSNYHYEAELVAALKSGGKNIAAAKALDHVYGYAVGLDMTRRDLQMKARDMGRPWDFGKSFDEAAPITHIHPFSSHGHHSTGNIWLKVNGEMPQPADLGD